MAIIRIAPRPTRRRTRQRRAMARRARRTARRGAPRRPRAAARKARERHVARGKLLARERVARLIDPGSPFLEIGALAAFGMYEGDVHGAGLVAGIGRDRGPRGDDRRQRSDDQGRRLLSDDGQEASARAGDRAREPAALRLSRRFRRRQPAASGRGVSRPRAFRPHLLQSGAHVGGGHRADRGGDGLLHRGRRLCAGDVRRDDHRREAGHDLSRRPAAGQGGDRRDGHAPRISAAAICTPASPASPTRWRATTRTRWRWPGARSPISTAAPRRRTTSSPRASRCYPAEELERHRADGPAPASTTCARSSRAWSTARSSTSSRRATGRRW